MARLGAVIAEAIALHYGRDEFLRRLAHPFWFQSFGAVMGMDWHSSGITTSVIGALKRGLAPLSGELGIHVCRGRGRHSRQTPHELIAIGERFGFDGADLARASRLVAKVDSAAVQDGFDLYLHGFIVTDEGKWVVVQQGMNGTSRLARRYHWLSENLKSFVDAPHTAIDGKNQGDIINLTDKRAEASRLGQIDLLRDLGPDGIVRKFAALKSESAPVVGQPLLPHLVMPAHHDVRPKDGGKDRHPFPVPLKVYDKTIEVLKSAVANAKLGNEDRLAALRCLDQQARQLERCAVGPSLPEYTAEERRRSHDYGGRNVFGWEKCAGSSEQPTAGWQRRVQGADTPAA
jgi:hypothetical protein